MDDAVRQSVLEAFCRVLGRETGRKWIIVPDPAPKRDRVTKIPAGSVRPLGRETNPLPPVDDLI